MQEKKSELAWFKKSGHAKVHELKNGSSISFFSFLFFLSLFYLSFFCVFPFFVFFCISSFLFLFFLSLSFFVSFLFLYFVYLFFFCPFPICLKESLRNLTFPFYARIPISSWSKIDKKLYFFCARDNWRFFQPNARVWMKMGLIRVSVKKAEQKKICQKKKFPSAVCKIEQVLENLNTIIFIMTCNRSETAESNVFFFSNWVKIPPRKKKKSQRSTNVSKKVNERT